MITKMKGGGSVPSDTTVTQITSNLPEYAEPFYLDLLARAGYESALPYEQYGGQRQAYFSPMEQQAMGMIGDLGTSGTPESLYAAGQSAYDMSQPGGAGINTNITSGYQAGNLGLGYNPQTQESGYQATPYDYEGGYNPLQRLSDYFYTQREAGFDPGSLADTEALAPYMSPYYQNVLDVEKREMSRQADIRNAATGLDAAGMGSLGGYREGLIRSEGERNLQTAMGDIQTRGSQAAFQSAQQAFEADRQARAQQEQFGQSQFALNEQMRQAQEEFRQGQFSMNEQVRQRATELRLQGYTMNEANKQAQEELSQSRYGLNQQALQAREDFSQNRYALQEEARQQQGIMALRAQEGSQYGQIAAARSRLDATGMLGDYAQQQQDMEFARINALSQAGLAERSMAQAGLDIGYEDFMRQQGWGWDQLGRYSNILQGLPYQQNTTSTSYNQGPSFLSQAAGTGVAGLGLYNAYR